MKMNKTYLALAILPLTTSAMAYQAQIDAGYTYFDHDSLKVDYHGVFETEGTYYFKAVDTENKPLNEAAFLGHHNRVSAKYSFQHIKDDKLYINETVAQSKQELHGYSIGGEYYIDQLYFTGEVGRQHYKVESRSSSLNGSSHAKQRFDLTTYRALVGYTPIQNLLIAAGINAYKGEGFDENAFALKTKYVTPLGQNGQYLNLELDGSFGHDIDSITFGGDYYLTQRLSLGSAYTRDTNSTSKIHKDEYQLRGKYFINNNLSLGSILRFSDDEDKFNINGTYRF